MKLPYLYVYSMIPIFFLSTLPLLISSSSASVPALYLFGDSLLDSGNSVYYKADFLPYGIDFEGGKSTGRFTNGKTVADFLAGHLGLPLVPAYSKLSAFEMNNITKGINYAHAASGILPETNHNVSLPLDIQIELFQSTVKHNLPKVFKDQEKLQKYLSESVFFLNTGVNDFVQNPTFKRSNKFALYLLEEFSIRLQRLYSLGARKFLVNNIPPAGCLPSIAVHTKPRGQCVEEINKRISFYNRKLSHHLSDLQSKLPDSDFSYGNIYGHLIELREHAEKYGIVETWKPCCPHDIYGDLKCHPHSEFCADRDSYLFFDEHPTQIANQIYATRCFHGDICSPSHLS